MNDVDGAQKVGMRGVLVKTGKLLISIQYYYAQAYGKEKFDLFTLLRAKFQPYIRVKS